MEFSNTLGNSSSEISSGIVLPCSLMKNAEGTFAGDAKFSKVGFSLRFELWGDKMAGLAQGMSTDRIRIPTHL